VFTLPKDCRDGQVKITALRTLYNLTAKETTIYVGLSDGRVLTSNDVTFKQFSKGSVAINEFKVFKESVAFLGFYEDLTITAKSVFTFVAVSSNGYLRLFSSPYRDLQGERQISV